MQYIQGTQQKACWVAMPNYLVNIYLERGQEAPDDRMHFLSAASI